MASYNARWSEIEKDFDEAYKAAMAKKEPENIIHSRQDRIKTVLHNYIDSRNKMLDDLLKTLGGFSDSLKEKSQADRWKTEISKKGQEAFKMIVDLDDNEESELNVFILVTATREADFFHKLASMQYGAMQGFLCECAKTLYDERKNLGGKWSATQSSARSLNERSERAGKQMLEAFQKAAKEIGNANRLAAELLVNGLLLLKKLDDARTGNEPGIPDLFEEMKLRTGVFVSTAKDVAGLYEDTFKDKGTTLVLYGNNRVAVREFLEKTNLEKAIKSVNEAQKNAESLAGSMLTAGQQSDAKTFVSEANEALQGPVNNYEKGFNDFVSEFKGIFIGPIGNKTFDQLLNGNFWYATEDSIKRMNFESELKRYYDQAENMWNIPLDGLDDTLKSAFKDQFKRQLREYDEEVTKSINTYTRVCKAFFIDYPISKLKEQLKQYKGWNE